MTKWFGFSLRTNACVGAGAALKAASFARERGARRVSIVIDAGLRSNEHATKLLDALREVAEIQVLESDAVEPDYDYLDDFRTRVDPSAELLTGVGGGSVLDLTKAVSVLVTNPKPAIEYRGFGLVTEPGIPVVAIPTTAGTGSEVTPNAVFTDRRENRKGGINSEKYVPVLALLDPLLTLSCPRGATVSAGMDALVHSVESFVAAGATPITRPLSREGFRLVMGNLRRVVEDPGDIDGRLNMQLGAFFAAAALFNSGAGPAGALSYPIGVNYKVPHGIAGAMFLGPVALWNVAQGSDAYAGLADALPDPPQTADPLDRSRAVAEAIQEIAQRVGVPGMQEYGVSRADVPELVEQAFSSLGAAFAQNPVEVTPVALHELMDSLV
jgi:alcohol dehydrogenase class IV